MTGGSNHIYCRLCGSKLGFARGRQRFLTAPFKPLPQFVAMQFGREVEYTLRMPRNPVCETCPLPNTENSEGE